MERYMNLATLDNFQHADTLAKSLSQNDMTARVVDETDMQRFLFLTKPKAFSIVQVPAERYADAVAAIQKLQEEGDPVCSHIFSCPECGSLAVEYPQFTRKYFITPLLIEWGCALGLFKKEFYCRKCHWTWPPVSTGESPKISMAPSIQVAPPD